MVNFVAPKLPPLNTAPDDPRIAHFLGKGKSPKVAIIGCPYDEGVRINIGRAGAALGPAAIREQFYKMTPDARLGAAFTAVLEQTVDRGDIALGPDIEANLETLGKAVGEELLAGRRVVVLGGGHEVSYGHYLGWVHAKKKCSLINFDAHTDVRDRKNGKPHSGSSFRLALQHKSKAADHYTVIGAQPQSIAASHAKFITDSGGEILWRDDTCFEKICEILKRQKNSCLVSLDLDVIDQAEAPGVSRPQVNGLSSDLFFKVATFCGQMPSVGSLDIVELNPLQDRDDQTARIAAKILWSFLAGMAA